MKDTLTQVYPKRHGRCASARISCLPRPTQPAARLHDVVLRRTVLNENHPHRRDFSERDVPEASSRRCSSITKQLVLTVKAARGIVARVLGAQHLLGTHNLQWNPPL